LQIRCVDELTSAPPGALVTLYDPGDSPLTYLLTYMIKAAQFECDVTTSIKLADFQLMTDI